MIQNKHFKNGIPADQVFKHVVFNPLAEQELIEAAAYYQEQKLEHEKEGIVTPSSDNYLFRYLLDH